MPLFGLLALTICLGLGAAAGAAPPGADRVARDQAGIGRVEAQIRSFGGALGVVAHFARSPSAEVECNAVCYYPSSTKAVAWQCAPKQPCVLHCLVNPPVGGCE